MTEDLLFKKFRETMRQNGVGIEGEIYVEKRDVVIPGYCHLIGYPHDVRFSAYVEDMHTFVSRFEVEEDRSIAMQVLKESSLISFGSKDTEQDSYGLLSGFFKVRPNQIAEWSYKQLSRSELVFLDIVRSWCDFIWYHQMRLMANIREINSKRYRREK